MIYLYLSAKAKLIPEKSKAQHEIHTESVCERIPGKFRAVF